MARYGQSFKNRAVARLLPPESASLEEVAREIGVGVGTLERWRGVALSMPARERARTAAARFDAVLTTAIMDEDSKGAWCRAKGVYPHDLAAWQQSGREVKAEARSNPNALKCQARVLPQARAAGKLVREPQESGLTSARRN